MKLFRSIFICFLFTAFNLKSQNSFTNIDTLLQKTFEAVNANDSSKYLALLNYEAIFKNRKSDGATDSAQIVKTFIESYNDFRESIADMVNTNEFTLSYLEYASLFKKPIDTNTVGKIPLQVKIIVNDTFAIEVMFMLSANKGVYILDSPLAAMFLDN